jgi:hypothetical protein
MIRVKVLYWAQAKEAAGNKEEYYELKRRRKNRGAHRKDT